MKVRNRTFIVSGGSSGLGHAAVQELVKAGSFVSILDIQSPPPGSDSHVLFIKTDITQVEEVERAVEATVSWAQETGAVLGGVINAAGIGRPQLTLNRKGKTHSTELWNQTLNVNLSGTFHLSRLAAQHLSLVPREEGPDGERGVIIMISSSVASDGTQGQVAYAASKGAIEAMTLPLARDLAPFAIRVVTLSCGLFTTPMTDQFKGPIADGLQQNSILYPKRFGLPSEFATMVKWVLETTYVNAETLKINGGIRVAAWL